MYGLKCSKMFLKSPVPLVPAVVGPVGTKHPSYDYPSLDQSFITA